MSRSNDLSALVLSGRPGLAACLQALREGDTLIVWKLDRLGRSLRHLVILILTGLIAIVIVFAVWNLGLKIFHAVLSPQNFDPTD